MGRNIDLDDMINGNETKCCKCDHINLRAFEEFDIDCYEFENGHCYYEFNCMNCNYLNTVMIRIRIEESNK